MNEANITSDKELLNAVRAGDLDAFKTLVKKYEKRIAATIYGMLGDCPEVDDVGQETFIRFYQRIDAFKGESSLITYLTRIAINLSLNELKRRKRQHPRTLPLEAARRVAGQNKEYEQDQNQLVHNALQQLDAKYRSVVVLRLLEEYSTKETADILKLPQGTVLSRLSRGLEKLKELLAPQFEEIL